MSTINAIGGAQNPLAASTVGRASQTQAVEQTTNQQQTSPADRIAANEPAVINEINANRQTTDNAPNASPPQQAPQAVQERPPQAQNDAANQTANTETTVAQTDLAEQTAPVPPPPETGNAAQPPQGGEQYAEPAGNVANLETTFQPQTQGSFSTDGVVQTTSNDVGNNPNAAGVDALVRNTFSPGGATPQESVLDRVI